MPVIVAGLRIATVTIGLVTVTSLIGLSNLGQFIIDGINRLFSTPLVLGAVLSILLAVAIDAVLLGAAGDHTLDEGEGEAGMNELIDYVTANWDLLIQRTVEHLILSAWSLLIALALALPLALWLGHTGKGAFIAINSSNIGEALPSLGLLAIFVSIPFFGLSDRATIAALVALAIPPILTNAYVGIAETDRDVVEAARGMGLTETAILGRVSVELPLAAPVIMAGVRTSASQVVATATWRPGSRAAGWDALSSTASPWATPPDPHGRDRRRTAHRAHRTALPGLAERAVTPKGLTVGRAGADGRRVRPGPARWSRKREHAGSGRRRATGARQGGREQHMRMVEPSKPAGRPGPAAGGLRRRPGRGAAAGRSGRWRQEEHHGEAGQQRLHRATNPR